MPSLTTFLPGHPAPVTHLHRDALLSQLVTGEDGCHPSALCDKIAAVHFIFVIGPPSGRIGDWNLGADIIVPVAYNRSY
jgi:hypothetical protein